MGLIVWFSHSPRRGDRVESSSRASLFAIDVTQNDRICIEQLFFARGSVFRRPSRPEGRQGRVLSARVGITSYRPSKSIPLYLPTASTCTRGELRSFARRKLFHSYGRFSVAGCAKPHQSGVFHGVSFRPVRWMEKPLLCGFLTWLYWVFFNSMRWSVGLLFRTFCVVVPYNSRKIPI